MGFNQLEFPIGLLLLGLGVSLIAALFEKLLDRLKLYKKEKVQNTKLKKAFLKRLMLDLTDYIQNMNEDEFDMAKLKIIMDILGTDHRKKIDTKHNFENTQLTSVDKIVVQTVKEATNSNESHDLVD